MNRIDRKFQELRREGRKALITFITAGDPDMATTGQLVLAFDRSGADIVELGVPFSDPMADGPTIQASSFRALKKGATLAKILNLVKDIRRHSEIPIALMTYYNPVFRFGEEKFVREAVKAGVDGVIIPDLPPEEAVRLRISARQEGLATVFFLAPTTTPQRMKTIIQQATGFIYYVSLTGVTGARQRLPASLFAGVQQAKRLTRKPVCVGFGIASPDQVREIARFADGVIVGSAIVKAIEKNAGNRDLVASVSHFVSRLARPLRT
ncbi:MAG: tryptophan synthase subunit alpha [Candidatus Omnitrophota bacterium]|nr:tryptophan synthase subunit alpha [Candidatus Omnitrophota bacterium]MDZ4241319.1 tryptophan synthase subunit alpha [Candidatus Omnitrophota bacterium]